MQKYGKSNTQNEIFFEVFWRGLVFNGMEMAFLYRLKPLAQNNLLRRTQASGNGTKEMVWNAQARDEGGRDGIAGTERRGGDFYGCSGAICSPLRYRSGHWQFLQIQDRFFMGLMG